MPCLSFPLKDDTEIYYKDWGTGQPVVFSHGWPLNADAWDPQVRMMAENGFLVRLRRQGVLQQTDLTEDLKRFDIPTLIAHGDDDQIVPIVAAAEKSSKSSRTPR